MNIILDAFLDNQQLYQRGKIGHVKNKMMNWTMKLIDTFNNAFNVTTTYF